MVAQQKPGLLDSAFSVSFISERLAQRLRLHRTHQSAQISGIAGLSHHSHTQSVASFSVSSAYSHSKEISVTAIVVPGITCDLPTHKVSMQPTWKHLSGLQLSDPEFGKPDRIDLLFGVDVFSEVMKHGWRRDAQGSPTALETTLGWVWLGVMYHRLFTLIMQSRYTHLLYLGTRSTAVKHFLSLERSLNSKGQFNQFSEVIQEYFDMGHAEQVPPSSTHLSPEHTFYLPMHAVRKSSSSTTKIRAVFDASVKSSSGVSQNDLLLVGPTVHSTLLDVLLRFRTHCVALTTDVSRMYRAVLLTESDKDLHRFVWRKSTSEPLKDFRMTRVTFGVSSLSFIANMCVKQNALHYASEFPLASEAVHKSF